ncbi:MAG: LLM class flavin-dependent oxidoreductase [Candidatus Bathyarchaeia archaeon]
MKFGISPSPHPWWGCIENFKLWVSEIERHEYDAIFIPDHYNLPTPDFPSNALLDTWSTLAFTAAITERIRIGSCVTPIPRYIPSQIAKIISMVDVLSEGRVIAGFGSGWYREEFINYSPQGYLDEPKLRTRRFLEGLQIIIRLWHEYKVTFNGKYYRLRDAILLPKPKQKPHPPLWLGGMSAPMLKIAAKYFDAWIPPRSRPNGERVLTPERYEGMVKVIKKYLQEYNRSVDKFTFAILGWINDDINLIERYVRAGCQHYVIDITTILSHPKDKIDAIRRFAEEVIPSFK